MGKGTCFIINECNYGQETVEEIKKLLLENGYVPDIAEELSTWNIDLWEYKIVRPIKNAEFVLVILNPKGDNNRYANFNVAFEFGYSKGTNKDIVLLFDGKLRELPADISRDDAISLMDKDWKEKLKKLIKRQIEKKSKKLASLEPRIINLMEDGIGEREFITFAYLLQNFAVGFDILNNKKVVTLIIKIFDEKKYTITNGEGIIKLLLAWGSIYLHNEWNDEDILRKKLITYIPLILRDSTTVDIVHRTLDLLLIIGNKDSYHIIIDYISKTDEHILEICRDYSWNFQVFSRLDFCIGLLEKLPIFRTEYDPNLSGFKLNMMKKIRENLTVAISRKYQEQNL